MSNATDFIEVYAFKKEYKGEYKQPYRTTPIFPINCLQENLAMTAKCQPMETVAIFKIKFK